MGQLSLDKTFLLAAWAEGITYGFFLCIFCATLYITFSRSDRHDQHSTIMTSVSSVMFFIASFHLAMNCYRLLEGYIDHAGTPGGPVAYIGNLRPWHHILKDTLYATQEILGDAAAIYRCWVLWNHNWKIILFPCILMVVSIVSGYTVCALYAQVDPTATVFDVRLTHWIRVFYSVAVVQNIITTSLMSYRIWDAHKKSSAYKTGNGFIPILRILVESAALQLFIEIVLLGLYCGDINAQYILLECVASVVGITFNAITIRIKLHSYAAGSNSGSSNAVRTIGSIPMRRINISVTHDVEDQIDSFDNK